MTITERLRGIALIPWAALQWWRVGRAWGLYDWPRMISLLRRIAEAGLDSNGDQILLGIALARQGRFPEALWHFEKVTQQDLFQVEQPLFFNEYAYVLARTGKPGEARQLLRGASRDRWPDRQRRWAEEFLAGLPEPSAPPLGDLKPRVLH